MHRTLFAPVNDDAAATTAIGKHANIFAMLFFCHYFFFFLHLQLLQLLRFLLFTTATTCSVSSLELSPFDGN